MSSNLEKSSHKLGANRKEFAHTSRRARSPSESRDIREDRGERQAKFAQPDPTTSYFTQTKRSSIAPQRSKTALPFRSATPVLLPEHSSTPATHPVHVRLFRDGAHAVFVAGSFNDWKPGQTPLHISKEGGWEAELSLPAGDYEYRFVVDGEWVDDPLACRVVANPFGGVNAVLHVHGA